MLDGVYVDTVEEKAVVWSSTRKIPRTSSLARRMTLRVSGGDGGESLSQKSIAQANHVYATTNLLNPPNYPSAILHRPADL